jgi:hypothetical protein
VLGWIIEHGNGRIGWSAYATADPNEGEATPFPVSEANAAFIVRAVNCHDELLAVLTEICESAGPAGWTRDATLSVVASAVIDRARAALAKAEDRRPVNAGATPTDQGAPGSAP